MSDTPGNITDEVVFQDKKDEIIASTVNKVNEHTGSYISKDEAEKILEDLVYVNDDEENGKYRVFVSKEYITKNDTDFNLIGASYIEHKTFLIRILETGEFIVDYRDEIHKVMD
ncbi:hypothetical protein IWW36_002671 [Coemansia brasiliensis]|uniref:Uncharacterized protein n=1 Tax=Coemansia brasiliensis TaxID=2650707 RepID=A0A9W8M0T3_9FUNG|nr:hypothetical protein IWW36_002671 [Coemansia brasiliensis]